jgi:hypothetical protein
MPRLRAALPALFILAIALIANAAAYWNELEVARADQNDNVAHYTLAARIVKAVENGENPFDAWSPEWAFGYSQLRTYPILSHVLVAGSYFATGKIVSLPTVFITFRYLAVVLLPLSFFVAALLLGFEPMTAAAAALLSPLVATNDLFGLEYGSYAWHGRGLFAQAVATHVLLLALGYSWRAVRGRGLVVLAGVLVAAAFLAHFIFGYVAAVSVVLMAVLPGPETSWRARLLRVAGIGGVALAMSLWQIVPLWQDRAIMLHSIWEPAWKWDSYGAPRVLGWLFTGQLLDYGRLPVLSVLALIGAALGIWAALRRRLESRCAFLLAGFVVWTALYFGRPFWGRALILFGIPSDFQLHRLSGAVHLFLVFLAAMGLAAIWTAIAGRTHWLAAAAVTALVLYPVASERWHYLSDNYTIAYENLARYNNVATDLDALADLAHQRGGRLAFVNTAIDRGVPLQHFMDTREVEMIPHKRHSMNLTSDITGDFHAENPLHYELFNIHTVAIEGEAQVDAVPFLKPLPRIGAVALYEAPGRGYFGLVDVPAAVPTTRDSFLQLVHEWLYSGWPAAGKYLWLDFGDAPAGMQRVGTNVPLPEPAPSVGSTGTVLGESRHGENYTADVEAARDCFLLFRMTWHPNWHVYIDGHGEPSMMLTPGFLGAHVKAGRHHIECRYEPGSGKIVLALAGVLFAVAGQMIAMCLSRRASD